MKNATAILRFLWRATRGHHLAPWRSAYLRWRIETYTGLKMDKAGFFDFWEILWRERHELVRFLKWTAQMQRYAKPQGTKLPRPTSTAKG